MGHNGWLPDILVAVLSGKVKYMSFKYLCGFKLNGEGDENLAALFSLFSDLLDNYVLVRGDNFLNHSNFVTCVAQVEPMSLMCITKFTGV